MKLGILTLCTKNVLLMLPLSYKYAIFDVPWKLTKISLKSFFRLYKCLSNIKLYYFPNIIRMFSEHSETGIVLEKKKNSTNNEEMTFLCQQNRKVTEVGAFRLLGKFCIWWVNKILKL